MLNGIISLAVAKEVMAAQLEVQQAVDKVYTSGQTYEITYDISSRGAIKGNLDEFRRVVAETYADPRGWIRAGVKFKEVASGGQLHVVLATGAEVEAASPHVCSSTLSCRVGRYALINDDRWLYATDSYNSLNISLLEYRQMVINHETGHYLGHDHIFYCETATGLGPVMLQQSTGLRGCKYNPWPLPSELWVRL